MKNQGEKYLEHSKRKLWYVIVSQVRDMKSKIIKQVTVKTPVKR